MKRWGAGCGARAGILVLAALSAPALPSEAQTPPNSSGSLADHSEFDLPTYQRELSRIEEVSKNPTGISGLGKSLPDTWRVREGEQIYFVPTKEISEELQAMERDPKKAASLEARLKAMEQQAEELSHPSEGVNPGQAEEKLRQILKRREFQEATGPSAWDLIRARINRWIFDHLMKLFEMLHISQKTGNAIGWAVLFFAVVALFYVVYRWLTKSTEPVELHAEVEPVASDARHWVREALAAADRGDFRDAVHCAYWASVAHLEDIHILPRDRARTPRESLRLLEQHPKEQGTLQVITRRFELIWYGYRPVTAAEWAGTKSELEKMGCLEDSTAPTVPS
jgi:Domain of unknown function (DUF4129)